jgi:hypothetical protein
MNELAKWKWVFPEAVRCWGGRISPTASTWIINPVYIYFLHTLWVVGYLWLNWGGLAAVWKIDHLKCVGKGHGWIRRIMKPALVEWNGALLAVCVWIELWEDNSRKVKWSDCVDCGMERLIHLCCAVLRWVKWTERNGVKGGWRWGTNGVPRNEMREENEPTASTWK